MEKAKVEDRGAADRPERRFQKNLLLGLAGLACLTPLGVLLPRMWGAGGAWGEWDPVYLEKSLGYVPEGLRRTTNVWKAPLAGYTLSAGTFPEELLSYAICGFAGLLLVLTVSLAVMKVVRKYER